MKDVKNTSGVRIFFIGEPYRLNPLQADSFDLILGNWESEQTREYYFPIFLANLAFTYQNASAWRQMKNISLHSIFRQIEDITIDKNLFAEERINGFGMLNHDCATKKRYKGKFECPFALNRREVN